MRFKHTFNIFVDNFSVVYKQMLYRLIISIIAGAITFAGVYPFIRSVLGSPSFNSLIEGVKSFISSLLKGHVADLTEISERVQTAFKDFMVLLNTKTTQFVLCGLLVVFIYMVSKWFAGLGNYAAAAVINDKMAFRANTPFLSTLIRNLRQASLYNLIYVPLSIVYDLLVAALMFVIAYYLLPFFLGVFVFMLALILAISVQMTFTTDWLPALIRGKMGQKQAFIYTFSRKKKGSLNVLSNFIILILIIIAVNVMAALFTLGTGLLVTIPSSYVVLLCFELVNYYDREEIKYFIDKNTLIKPVKEHTPTREEFFRGEN